MRIGKFYPITSHKLLQIHDYIDIIASDKNGQDVILKCEIEDVVQMGENSSEGDMFVFCVKGRDTIKLLYF